MSRNKFFLLLTLQLLISIATIPPSNSYMVNNNPYRQRERMDRDGDFILEWEYFPEKGTIIFDVVAKTTGYVGMGLSKEPNMMNADFIIAGVDKSGVPYVNDMYTKGNRKLIQDSSQDWKLLEALEEHGVTKLRFSRAISTCDEQDVEITKDHIVVLWAFGEDDTLSYHYQYRGTIDAYLLDPNMTPELNAPPKAPGLYGSSNRNNMFFSLRRESTLEGRPTQYLSSIHRGPRLSKKHHIIGSRVYLGNEASRRHTHHLVLFRCDAPEGIDPQIIFEPFIGYPGEEHYLNENRRLPTEFCLNLISVWGVGGKPFFFDDSVGLPIGGKDEYLLLQVHFDNGDMREPTLLQVGVDLFLEPNTINGDRRDGRFLLLGFNVPGALIAIPPASIDFSMIGHCDSACNRNMFPPKGVRASGVMLHSHRSARKLSLRHFRNGKELEPVLSDDNYNPTFQQYRLLQKEITFHQGDHFVMQCESDNTQYNGTTVGGFGTHQEMCIAFVIISSVIYNDRCVSEYPAYRLLSRLGVENVTWDTFLQDRVVTAPRSLRGLTLGQVGDQIKWTSGRRRELENDVLYGPQPVLCPTSLVPSVRDILRRANVSLPARAPKPHTPQPFKSSWLSLFGGGSNNNNHKNNDLQSQVRAAVQRQLQQGSMSLLRSNDPGSIIMRASTGRPFVEERNPAGGLSSRINFPTTAQLPKDVPEYRGNYHQTKTCSKTNFKLKGYQDGHNPTSFLNIIDGNNYEDGGAPQDIDDYENGLLPPSEYNGGSYGNSLLESSWKRDLSNEEEEREESPRSPPDSISSLKSYQNLRSTKNLWNDELFNPRMKFPFQANSKVVGSNDNHEASHVVQHSSKVTDKNKKIDDKPVFSFPFFF